MPVRILRRRNQSVQGRFRCSWQEMHGILVYCIKNETIGDPIRPVEAEDIKRAGRLMYVTAVLTLLFAGMIRFWYFW